ncbi:MAG TPA: sigma-70 family RNA polymerase sigma factor [Thermoanaerobaculia bacterium]|nr:sigma-70 family RNA polymerase sigma factor [Thermoanaerobaculia bacterium]
MSAARPIPRPVPPTPLEEVFREYGDLVFRTAFRVSGSAADAEDVLQTVFLRLASPGKAERLGAEPRGYLQRAAVNGALDLVRTRRSAAGTVPIEERADAFLAKEPLPDAVSEARELRGRLRRALGKLAPRPAEVFVLRAVEGLTNREVARLLGSSPATVAVQYFRARTQLRKELLAEGGGPS